MLPQEVSMLVGEGDIGFFYSLNPSSHTSLKNSDIIELSISGKTSKMVSSLKRSLGISQYSGLITEGVYYYLYYFYV